MDGRRVREHASSSLLGCAVSAPRGDRVPFSFWNLLRSMLLGPKQTEERGGLAVSTNNSSI